VRRRRMHEKDSAHRVTAREGWPDAGGKQACESWRCRLYPGTRDNRWPTANETSNSEGNTTMHKHKNMGGAYANAMKAVRRNADGAPDLKDVRSVSAAFHAQHSPEWRAAQDFAGDMGSQQLVRGPAMGASRRMDYGARPSAGARMDMDCDHPRKSGKLAVIDPETGAVIEIDSSTTNVPYFRADPSCAYEQPCSADLLGFNTLFDGGFPIEDPAAVVGPVSQNRDPFVVTSDTADKYIPRYFFWEGRDVNDSFEVLATLLVDARIGPSQQLVSAGNARGITSSVFALTNTPLPVAWNAFRNVDGQTLNLTFGAFIPGSSTQIFGVFWGDAGVIGN